MSSSQDASDLPATPSQARFVVRWLVTLLSIIVPAFCWGLLTANAQASFGPHVAQYRVTVDDVVTIDLGPLGTVVVDSPLPLVLGARVVVQEIPREVTAVSEASTLTAVGADLQSYVQFFSGPQETLDVVARALLLDTARRTALAVATIGLVTWALRSVIGPARGAELAARLRGRAPAVAAGVVATLLVTATVTSSGPGAIPAQDRGQPSAVFDGTPLEGARITGRLAGVIDTYGTYLVDAYQDNELFYDAAVVALDAVWIERATADAQLAAALGSRGVPVAPPPSTPFTSGSATETPEVPTPEDRQLVTLLTVSDLHCNIGMARVIREVAELAGAQVILNAGDTTINGTGVEAYCVSALVGATPEGAHMVVSDGNHDSEETSTQERDAGALVLDGAVVEVEGLRILGDADPNATRIGAGTTQVGEEGIREVARRLADVACADEAGVDLLLVHNPNVGNLALDEGCVPAQVSGHLHRRIGPVPHGRGVRYVSTSTAGAAVDAPTVGPLHGTAEITILHFDPVSQRFVDYRVVRLMPDGGVSVGFQLTWPGPFSAPGPATGPR
jgi:hypothetical protein